LLGHDHEGSSSINWPRKQPEGLAAVGEQVPVRCRCELAGPQKRLPVKPRARGDHPAPPIHYLREPSTPLFATPAEADPVGPPAPHGIYRRQSERPIDLLAQIANVDVDDVGPVLVVVVPGVLEEIEP